MYLTCLYITTGQRLFRNLQRVKLQPFSMDRPLQKRVPQHLGLSETEGSQIHRLKIICPIGVCNIISPLNTKLVGDFNPSEKYESQIGSSSQLLGKIKVMFQTTNHQDTNHDVSRESRLATCSGPDSEAVKGINSWPKMLICPRLCIYK